MEPPFWRDAGVGIIRPIMEANLIEVCVVAFAAVMLVLGILWGLIRLLTDQFPEKSNELDPALVAAIHQAVNESLPGARVVKIEEIQD